MNWDDRKGDKNGKGGYSNGYSNGKGDRGYRGDGNERDRYDNRGYEKGYNEKGSYDKGGYGKGNGKSDEKGSKVGKGKGKREEKLIASGLRGKVIKVLSAASGKKPCGFIKRYDEDGKDDVYFDLADVQDDEEVKVGDVVDFDVVEGGSQRLYAARVKKQPKDTLLMVNEDKKKFDLSAPAPVTAAAAGSLTGGIKAAAVGSLTGGIKAATSGSLTGGLTSLKSGSLTGAISLRPGAQTGGTKKEEKPVEESLSQERHPDSGNSWGRVVSVRNAFGFLQPLGGLHSGSSDIFFRAADVVGMNCTDPGIGIGGSGLEITLPSGRNSNGFKTFWLNPDDEVSFTLSQDHMGKPCAVNIFKETKGAWRMGHNVRRVDDEAQPKEALKDMVNRLVAMEPDQVLQNASLFKEVLESPEFNPSHLYIIISMLACRELADDDRSATLYRLFLHSKTMQASLRTTIIKQAQGGRHCGSTFLEDCLRLLTELAVRSSNPSDLRGQLPLLEIVEAVESSVRDGTSGSKKNRSEDSSGLPEEMVQNLLCLQKHFPDEVNLKRILGTRAPKKHYTVSDDAAEIIEADYYQDMPILPTSVEMVEQCAFEIQENMRTYEKCEDYVQTHFMLLREDYIEPLRAGIKLYFEGKHSPKDLHVYTGVKVVGILSTWEGIVYRVELPKEQTRRINWEKTKQLMYGSLLCLSDDDFDTLIWATVWRRDEHLIANEGQIDIRLPFEPFDDRLEPGKRFTCIENVTIYFEAYRHVLIALQNMRPSDVPFQQTLLQPQPDPVVPPYLKGDDMFHFHNVFASCVKEDSPVAPPKCFNILQDWPETIQQSLDIDPSQLEAIQHSLTHQMGLIQGPPGTGKTWVGLKIVQAILDNTTMSRRSPILVVCYTNHALDQFLEGIFKFCEKIARIGSRSKSECLKDRNLKELTFQVESSKEYYQARRGLNDRRDTLREQFSKAIRKVNQHVIDFEDAEETIPDGQLRDFYQGYREQLGNKAKYVPEDYADIDEELWEKIMKTWLDTTNLSKLAKSMVPKISEAKTKDIVSDTFGDWEELANDDDEEAANETHDRVLDDGTYQDGKDTKKPLQDFYMELDNAWLPYLEDHLQKVSVENRVDSWRDEDLWELPLTSRREIYRRWLLEAHHEAREELPELARLIDRNADNRAALERDRKLVVLREMEVVGMTTTAVSKYQKLLKELRPEIVVVEEAAEVLEAHILTALHPRTQQCILIGDHQQLRPSTAVYRLSKNFHLDVSLFERLIRNGCAHVTLEQQRRMHPMVSRLMKPLYPNLRDHTSVSEYPDVMGVNDRTFFLSHTHLEDADGESHSKENSFESHFLQAFCAHLVKSGYSDSQITVLSPYLGQVRIMKNRFRRDLSTSNIQITAVDNFQGEENDIICISLVRSNRTKTMGFLSVENRINVALTRAKHGMFIVGNGEMLKGHPLWTQIMTTMRSTGSFGERIPLVDSETGVVVDVNSAEEISALLLDGSDAGDDDGGQKVADRWAGLGKSEKTSAKSKPSGNNGEKSASAKKKASQKAAKSDSRMPMGAPDPRAAAVEAGGKTSSNVEAEAPRAPPPKTLEADEFGGEAEVVPTKEDPEDSAAGKKVKGGKKQKQKGNQVVMRWG